MLRISEARIMIDELRKQEIALGRNPETWYTYKNHVFGTAELARKIAKELNMPKPNSIYVAALLHDICRIEEERIKRFHGVLGYEKMKNIDENVARSCLLHSFPWCKMKPYQECKDMFFNRKKDYDFIAKYISRIIPRDEDYLIQLCDNLANKNGLVTLEERAEEYIERHGNVDVDSILIYSKEIKKYFDKKLGHDIYDYIR